MSIKAKKPRYHANADMEVLNPWCEYAIFGRSYTWKHPKASLNFHRALRMTRRYLASVELGS